jgi:acyl-[acyl-carrier-protein]-phospholipid O-acyltransferase/long-chain-fatty-acid--[acyl-carrier-protein] ligase
MKIQSESSSISNLLRAQFFGAFNDNAWKMIVAFLAIKSATQGILPQSVEFESVSQIQTTLTFVVFTLPLMLFSLPAGALADRISKTRVIVILKAIELLLMLLATVSLIWPEHISPLIVLGLMGVQSALFSPVKYGIIPELLPHESISKGNGRLEMWTFLAIILGTALGGMLLDFGKRSECHAGLPWPS